MNKNRKLGAIFSLLIIVLLFIILSYLVQNNLQYIQNNLNFGFTSILIYLFLVALSIVLAPFGIIPLIPLARGIWGWKLAVIFTILGWTIGAVIAFTLSRKYGIKLVQKIISLEKINNFEKKFSNKNLFFTIFILRAVIPIDGVSYLLGLFPSVRFTTYLFASILGFIPFTLFIVYLGGVPIIWQILGGIFLISIIAWIFFKN